jgi:hypothetical protein
MRSNLEINAANALQEAGLEFDYEAIRVELWPSINTDTIYSLEHVKKKPMQVKNTALRPISYTPDFVGSNWIIETKGFRRPGFDLRWKMFKGLLHQNNVKAYLFLPSSLKEVKECIEVIKVLPKVDYKLKDVLLQYSTNKRILRKPKDLKLPVKRNSKRSKKRSSSTDKS